jgi:uncharacterized protein (DUF2126 family)/transglutaminase-like putative cysteine protease
MGTKVSLHHRTAYRYDREVALGPQVIQLRPTPHSKTPIVSYALDITPADHTLNWQMDPHANYLVRVLFVGRATEFVVEVNLVADMTPINPFAFFLEPGYENFPFAYSAELAGDLEPFRRTGAAGPLLRGFVEKISREPQGTVGFLVGLNQRVRDEVAYVTRMEQGVQTTEETLALRTGSCRDSAWLLVEVLRQVGMAARFVSGYLIQLAGGSGGTGGPTGPVKDSADLHAWAEVFLPGAGWIGMDPTSGLLAAEGHIPLVCTPTAAQAAPIGGTVEPSGVDFSFAMSVQRMGEAAAADLGEGTGAGQPFSRPFREEAWTRVREVAHQVDRDLQAQDVQLTMGGEPTYVGVDEAESPQWNIEALGPGKRERGLALIRRLRERTAPAGLLHFGQGKWYPGEQLPRWAFHCISRVDGVPVWENLGLIGDEKREYGFGVEDGLAFLQALARRLQVSEGNILPAFDPEGWGAEGREPAGYILPLRRRQPGGRLAWSSQLWFERPERMVLSPGDSPIGYRILVATMPFVAPDELRYEKDDAGLVRLAAAPARRKDLFSVVPEPDPLPPLSSTAELAAELIRPALCVQVREGRVHVFLPYVPIAADYLDLVAAVEDTCQYLERPVWLEGYTPPADPRLRAFSLTPDPGVLEVNLPPTSHWDELEAINAILFEEALENRLIAGKFGYDGTHLATGGGSHIVIGGATVPDSPILRRPDLLRSMIAFWQHHPSLSYLFSGMYVGPTSQYPRVDEARTDALYELELAFSQLPANRGASQISPEVPADIVDGLFRNLLVDVTGNSHRAEFCIDKLYPPYGQGLQLGLLELRAFEMAPHYRMGLVEMLLVRALVSIFWRQPFAPASLVRWGTALHGRFMLPHFVQSDFAEVLGYLRQGGYGFEEDWFAPHYEFRFPKIGSLGVPGAFGAFGSIDADGVELELRQALEPWNVLAEEATSGGTGRSVDSSLERMQVRLTGQTTEDRYVVTCNGRSVPLQSTGAAGERGAGEMVGGVRYRARRLSAALHPTIPVHTPLTFDLIDTWKERSVGRCTYYAGPPDGRVYRSRPANAAEARERRLERFVVSDPPSGRMVAPVKETNPVYPMTLDLRWPPPRGKQEPER